ncbi:hypothetical protein GO755_39350 [Spirosoma sp. HMF4905]|uniref:RHS repeat protein n=1 Tax=Spirosoma arboris TaxID=2682092 RepID=A0A7K1SQP7_9BACT|nr:hypothetical protein [Spirosoma arboris]MVM36135.1 hypothetical protein [Spirosoma arboris]
MISKLTILIFTLVSLTLHAQNEEKKYELERLTRKKNHIKEGFIYDYDIVTNDSSLVSHNFYDSTGNMTKRKNYNPNGKHSYDGIFTYNDKGLKIQETGYDENGDLMQVFVYTYDNDGNQTDYQQLSPNRKILVHQKRVFNSKRQQTELYNKLYNEDKFHLAATYSYNAEGNQIGSTTYTKNGDTGDLSEYTYDSYGNLTAIYHTGNQGKILVRTDHYDDKQQLIESKFYQRNKYYTDGQLALAPTDRRTVFKYDIDGNKIEELEWNKTVLVKRTRYYFIK